MIGLILSIITALILAVIILSYLIDYLLNYKCPHAKYCKWYNEESFVCNETGGYYDYEYPAGCCRYFDNLKSKSKLKSKLKGRHGKIKGQYGKR